MTPCDFCSTPTSNPRFCSVSCSARSASAVAAIMQRSRVSPNPQCERKGCDEVVKERRQRFCSRSCWADSKKGRLLGPGRCCLRCGVRISTKKFCSHDCHRRYEYDAYIQRWLQGEESGSQDKHGEITSQARRWVEEQRGRKCWECGWAAERPCDGVIPVQVDHLDGNYRNNRPENLRLLCPNCHSLTSTWGRIGGRTGGRAYRYSKQQVQGALV